MPKTPREQGVTSLHSSACTDAGRQAYERARAKLRPCTACEASGSLAPLPEGCSNFGIANAVARFNLS